MHKLTTERILNPEFATSRATVPSGAPRERDLKRMLEHVISLSVSEVLAQNRSNPVGLTVTVSVTPGTENDEQPQLSVFVTTPVHDRTNE